MKNYFFLLLFSLCFMACSDDDEGTPDNMNEETCMQEDWVGTYDGTENCNGEMDDATIVVTSSDDKIMMEISNSSSTVTIPAVSFDGCSISETVDLGIIPVKIEGSLDTDNLVIDTDLVGSKCTYTMTRR